MTPIHPPEQRFDVDTLNERIKQHVKGNWLHNFHVDANRQLISAESYAYRRKVFDRLFSSLFRGRSVLVLDEVSGFYPALVHRAGCKAVTVSSSSSTACEVISDLLGFLEIPATVLKSKFLAFYDGEPYVDMQFGERHDFLLGIGQIWPLFGASTESFDAIAEACGFFVTEGLVFDWNDAKWANPPPPAHYTLDAFCDALRKKFEFVICYSDWLVVAAGKLPVGTEGERKAATEEERKAAYNDFLPRFRNAVCEAVPPGSTVAVVSKGDSQLLDLENRVAWHFPQSEDGGYTGYYPRDSAAAIRHLEELRGKGAEYLIFPQHSLWWLEHYSEFRQHLEMQFRCILADAQTATIYQTIDMPHNREHQQSVAK